MCEYGCHPSCLVGGEKIEHGCCRLLRMSHIPSTGKRAEWEPQPERAASVSWVFWPEGNNDIRRPWEGSRCPDLVRPGIWDGGSQPRCLETRMAGQRICVLCLEICLLLNSFCSPFSLLLCSLGNLSRMAAIFVLSPMYCLLNFFKDIY